jgi:hypothetical protein
MEISNLFTSVSAWYLKEYIFLLYIIYYYKSLLFIFKGK